MKPKWQRQQESALRKAEWRTRTLAEQLTVILARPGNSYRELERLCKGSDGCWKAECFTGLKPHEASALRSRLSFLSLKAPQKAAA